MDSGATSHMTYDIGNLSVPLRPSSHTPSHIIIWVFASYYFHCIDLLPCCLLTPSPTKHPGHTTHNKNLICVCQFTTDNNCSIKFDPFDLSMKDLPIKNVIDRCNSSGHLYSLTIGP